MTVAPSLAVPSDTDGRRADRSREATARNAELSARGTSARLRALILRHLAVDWSPRSSAELGPFFPGTPASSIRTRLNELVKLRMVVVADRHGRTAIGRPCNRYTVDRIACPGALLSYSAEWERDHARILAAAWADWVARESARRDGLLSVRVEYPANANLLRPAQVTLLAYRADGSAERVASFTATREHAELLRFHLGDLT